MQLPTGVHLSMPTYLTVHTHSFTEPGRPLTGFFMLQLRLLGPSFVPSYSSHCYFWEWSSNFRSGLTTLFPLLSETALPQRLWLASLKTVWYYLGFHFFLPCFGTSIL